VPSKDELVAHFRNRLAFESDPSDVYSDLDAGKPMVLVDVRGQDAWDQGRAKGAMHIPHAAIIERAPQEISFDTPVVVYCWGPGCNGAQKGALNFALLGYQVKEMIGGFEYWAREGYPVEDNHGPVTRERDPLTIPINSPRCDCS